jgi:hypothetical protein
LIQIDRTSQRGLIVLLGINGDQNILVLGHEAFSLNQSDWSKDSLCCTAEEVKKLLPDQ